MLAAHTHGARRARLHSARWAGRKLSLVDQHGAGRLHVLALANGAAASRVFVRDAWQCIVAEGARGRPDVCLCYLNRLTVL